MPLHHAVLAMLTENDSYGYQLKTKFETVIGPQWGGLNIGHLYQVLDRLVRDDYATRERVEQQTRPDRHLYRITNTGRDELERWLAEGHVRSSGYRDELILKLFAAAQLGDTALATVVAAQRRAYLAELATLEQLRRQHADDPLVSLLLKSARLHTEADLKTTDAAEHALAGLAQPSPDSAIAASSTSRHARSGRTEQRTG